MPLFHSVNIRVIAVAAVMIFFSCRKGMESRPSWETTLLVPLLQSTLTLDDLLADSLLQTTSDHSVSLVLHSQLYSTTLQDSVFEIPDTSLITALSLENLNLANNLITTHVSLGQMCLQLGGIGLLIIAANGLPFTIPPFVDITSPDNDLDATGFFETADIESGTIDITLENGLPIVISNMEFQIKNKVDQQILATETFSNLQPGESQTRVIDLSGKHVEGTLVATITDFDSPGGTVVIDTSDAIVLTMKTNEIKVSTATAVFPSQNLIDKDEDITYNLSGGAQLSTIHVKSGELLLEVVSTIPQQSHFEYSLPTVTDALGNSVFVIADLPPAPVNGSSTYLKSFDLAGYTFDLTGINGTSFNTVSSSVVASIDSTGEVVTISKSDSIYINYTLRDIVPDYVSGFLGQQIVRVNETSAFDVLHSIKGGTVGLEDAEVVLTLSNGIGVEGRVNLYELTALNTNTGSQIPLQWDELNQPLGIGPATENPFAPATAAFILNNTNSNIHQLISGLPDEWEFALDIFINPNGNSSSYHDFAFDSSQLAAALDLTLPLSLVANDLVLSDTFDFNLGTPDPADPQIREGTFTLIVYNGFPISAGPQIYFYDDDFVLLDSLFVIPQLAEAASLNDECLVVGKTKSELVTDIDESKMKRLQAATRAVMLSTFNTAEQPGCGYIRIYDDYAMEVKLTGSFIYFTGY